MIPRMSYGLAFMLITILAQAVISAPVTQPASLPATDSPGSASRPFLDLSTPRKAFVIWTYASAANNVYILGQCLVWEDAEDKKQFVMNAAKYEHRLAEDRERNKLLLQFYPDDAAVKKRIAQDEAYAAATQRIVAEQVAHVEATLGKLAVKEEGNTAAITPQRGNPTKLKRVDGRWLVVQEHRNQILTPDTRKEAELVGKRQSREQELRRAAWERFESNVKAGKYASGKQALEALNTMNLEASAQAYKETSPQR